MANLRQGVPFRHDADLRPLYEGSFFGLLNPFGLLCGLVSIGMLVMHGTAMKISGVVAERSRRYGMVAAIATALLSAMAGLGIAWWVPEYSITSVVDPLGPSNPTYKRA